jgi:hypothetical protein
MEPCAYNRFAIVHRRCCASAWVDQASSSICRSSLDCCRLRQHCKARKYPDGSRSGGPPHPPTSFTVPCDRLRRERPPSTVPASARASRHHRDTVRAINDGCPLLGQSRPALITPEFSVIRKLTQAQTRLDRSDGRITL